MVRATYSDDFNTNTSIGPNGEFLAKKQVYIGAEGAQTAVPSKLSCVLLDDFLGDVIADQWSAAVGTDPQCVIATINAGACCGTVRLTSGDTVTLSESLSSLTHGLNWKAANGNLIFETKVTPVSSVANVSYFIGLTDTLATTTLEQPATLATTTMTYVADDCVGFVFDTAATTAVMRCVGIAGAGNGIAFANTISAGAPVAGTAIVLRVEIDTTGTATFYKDGTSLGSIASAVTAATMLTPVVTVMARTTASKSLDVDYIYCSQDRQ